MKNEKKKRTKSVYLLYYNIVKFYKVIEKFIMNSIKIDIDMKFDFYFAGKVLNILNKNYYFIPTTLTCNRFLIRVRKYIILLILKL